MKMQGVVHHAKHVCGAVNHALLSISGIDLEMRPIPGLPAGAAKEGNADFHSLPVTSFHELQNVRACLRNDRFGIIIPSCGFDNAEIFRIC